MNGLSQNGNEFARQLVEWARGKGRILIVAHDNPDPDALASAFALQHLLLVKTGRPALITFGGIIGRGENRVMAKELEIKTVPMTELDLDEFEVVCMVDTQPGTGNNSWPPERPVDVVIDHHPLREGTGRCRWVDVRENYGACATILYEYLATHEVYLGTKLATMLFYAIKSETQDLGREWVRADREAYLGLVPLCNNRILARITQPKMPRAYYSSFNRAIENARIYDTVLVFNLFEVDNPDIVAEMADFLLRAEGVETVLGMARFGEDQVLSLRTSHEDRAAGEAIRQVVGRLGSAGGHGMTAGGQIRLVPGTKEEQRDLAETLTRRLLGLFGITTARGRKLVSG